MSELKPCPFCGGEAETKCNNYSFDNRWRIHCLKCGACLPERGTLDDAITAWNRRDYSEILKAIYECEKWKECLLFLNGGQLKQKIKELSK